MDADEALELFFDQEDANVPIPQFSDSDQPESDDDNFDGFSNDSHVDPLSSDDGTATQTKVMPLKAADSEALAARGFLNQAAMIMTFFGGNGRPA